MKLLFIANLINLNFIFSQATSPCASYYNSDTTNCNSCSSGLLVVDSTYTFCSYYTTTVTNLVCYIDSTHTYYSDTTGSAYYGISNIDQYKVVQKNSQTTLCFYCTNYGSSNCASCSIAENYQLTPEMRTIQNYSLGCIECNDNYTISYKWDSRIGMYQRTCTQVTYESMACGPDEYFEPSLGFCRQCGDKFPNCAACSATQCLICLENFYFSSYLDPSGNTVSMCAFQTCAPGYGITQYVSTNCTICTIQNCKQCYFSSSGTQTCITCASGFYLSSTDTRCYLMGDTYTQHLFVQPVSYLASAAPSSTGDGSLTNPFLFIAQALTKAYQLSLNYRDMVTYIYLYKGGDHFYFYCDSETYSPTASDNTTLLYDYCKNLGSQLTPQYYQYDNNQIHIQALTCDDLSNLGYFRNRTICTDFSWGEPKPRIYINSPKYYFNVTNYMHFMNVKISGANQYAYHISNLNVKLRYFPLQFCNITTSNDENVGNMTFQRIADPSVLGFNYTCVNPYFVRLNTPNRTQKYKCLFNFTSPQSLGKCGGELYNQSYFTGYTYTSSPSTGAFYEDRRKTLFNLYAHNDYFGMQESPPTLILEYVDFEYFMWQYESLITVETYSMFTYTPQVNFAENYNVYYGYNGADRGAIIEISGSTFNYSNFCKGMIVYRKPPSLQNYTQIFNYTALMATTKFAYTSGSYIFIYNNTINHMNYASETISLTTYLDNSTRPQYPIWSGNDYQPTLLVPVFMNKGIILNVESFWGTIEIDNSTFMYNSVWIPEIFATNYTYNTSYSQSDFVNSVTNELELTVCDQTKAVNKYFFSSGFNKSTDIESFSTQFERISPFYISQNTQPIIINNCTFAYNIGTMGGVFMINSPNYQMGFPQVIVNNTYFTENMAYFSGGAIFIRNTIQSLTNLSTVCGGVSIGNSSFSKNFVLKKANGAAITIYCNIIDSTNEDFYSSSDILNTTSSSSNNFLTTMLTGMTNTPDLPEKYWVQNYSVKVENCSFVNNVAGLKGSAIYIRQANQVVLKNCTFYQNLPTLVQTEQKYSSYYFQFSNQSIVYYDENQTCFNEFNYISNCTSNTTYIDWPQVQGAVNIEFCNKRQCLNNLYQQTLLIYNCNFTANDVGPFLNSEQDLSMTSSLSINGGFQNTIYNCTFANHQGIWASSVKTNTSVLYSFMPNNYYNNSFAPVVSVLVEPFQSLTLLNYTTWFNSCTFSGNINSQIVGLDDSYYYYGSLVSYITNIYNDQDILPQLSFFSCSFNENYFIGPESSLIYVSSAIMQVYQNSFINNGFATSLTASSQLSKLQTQNKYFEFSSFSYLYAQYYGIFNIIQNRAYLYSNMTNTFTNNQFSYCFASNGSVYSIQSANQNFKFISNTYTFLFAVVQGAYMSVSSLGGKNVVFLEKELVTYAYSGINGALYSYNSAQNQMNFYILNSMFINCYSQSGSAISAYQIGKILSTSTLFTRNIFSNQTALILTSFLSKTKKITTFLTLDLLNSLVSIPQMYGYVYIDSAMNYDQIKFGSNILQNVLDPFLEYSEFIGCQFSGINGEDGSALYVVNSDIRMYQSSSNSSFQILQPGIFNMTGSHGTIYLDETATLIAENLQFINNSVTTSGSVVYMSLSSLSLISCYFYNNYASNLGTIYNAGLGSQLNISSSIFINNYANDSSIFYSSGVASSIISNTSFINNTSGQNLMNIFYTNITFTGCTFVDNIAQIANHGITMQVSSVIMNNSTINYTLPSFLNYSSFTTTQVGIGFFQLLSESTLNLTNNTSISNCRGLAAGVIYAQIQSNVYISNGVSITNCKSIFFGTFYLEKTGVVLIDQALFIGNSLMDLYAYRANISISDTVFDNGGQNYISATFCNLNLTNVTIQNLNNTSNQGNGLNCNCLALNIVNSTFQNLSSSVGGAVYLSLSETSTIYNSNFIQNSAQYGGAIYITYINTLNLTNNTFTQNSVSLFGQSKVTEQSQGGAIYYYCPVSTELYTCELNFNDGNQFISNYAEEEGGAIAYLSARPQHYGSSASFWNNSAQYGNNWSSYPKTLNITFISNNDPMGQSATSLRRLQNSSTGNWTIVSGTQFSFQIAELDQDLGLYSIDDVSHAKLVSKNASQNITLANYEVTANYGLYQFSDIQVNVMPGQSISLLLYVYGVKTYGNNIEFVQNPVEIEFYVRPCMIGESLQSDYSCEICPSGTYMDTAPESVGNCLECPTGAYCFAGKVVAPLPGYWRSTNTTYNFISCPHSSACIGGDFAHPQGECASPYLGYVCGECDANSIYTIDFYCQTCPEKILSLIRLAFAIFIAVSYISLMVRQTLISSIQQSPLLIGYFKIITDYFQLFGAMAQINYGWPTYMENFVLGMAKVNKVAAYIFYIDCLLQDSKLSDNSLSLFEQKVVLFAMLPLIALVLSILVWLLISVALGFKFAGVKNKIMLTFHTLIYFIYPSICLMIFKSFDCIYIDGIYRLRADLQTQCFTGSHLYLLLFISIPSLVFWIIGIPLITLAMLYRQREVNKMCQHTGAEDQEQLNKIMTFRIRYGFLIQGYNNERYYWEVVMYLRKMLMYCSSILLSEASPEVQILVCMFILLSSIFTDIYLKPYIARIMGKLAVLSALVLFITLYVGLHFVTSTHYNIITNGVLKAFLFLCFIFPHLGFFLYWLYYVELEFLRQTFTKSLLWFKRFTFFQVDPDEFRQKYMPEYLSRSEIYKIEDDDIEVEAENLDTEKDKTKNMNQYQDGMTREQLNNKVEDQLTNYEDVANYYFLKQKKIKKRYQEEIIDQNDIHLQPKEDSNPQTYDSEGEKSSFKFQARLKPKTLNDTHKRASKLEKQLSSQEQSNSEQNYQSHNINSDKESGSSEQQINQIHSYPPMSQDNSDLISKQYNSRLKKDQDSDDIDSEQQKAKIQKREKHPEWSARDNNYVFEQKEKDRKQVYEDKEEIKVEDIEVNDDEDNIIVKNYTNRNQTESRDYQSNTDANKSSMNKSRYNRRKERYVGANESNFQKDYEEFSKYL